MRHWLAALLMILCAAEARAVITVVPICDDCSRYTVATYRAAGEDTITVGADIHATPNLDAIATAGVRFPLFHGHLICSPFRAELATGRFVNRSSNGYGTVKDGESPATTVVEIDVGAPNIWNMAVEAGVGTAHFGKWHLGNTLPRGEFNGQTMLKAMGIQHADGIVQRNTNKADPLTDAEYTALTGFLPECLGHYSTVRTHDNGDTYITTDYSGEVEFGLLEAYLVWWDTNRPSQDLLVTFAPTAPHNPLADGQGGESCAGGDPADDRPPIPLHEGIGNDQVYYDMLADLDARIGSLRTVMAGLTHDTRLIFVADNGSPTGRTLPPELPLSSGAKGTFYPFGVFVPLLIEGFDIDAGPSGVIDGLYATPDLTATIAELIGARAPHRDGTSFAACLREDHGLTAATCPSRDFIVESRWSPLGSTSGTIDRRPLLTDGAGVYARIETWVYTTIPDATLRLFGRIRDVADANLIQREEFWEVPLSGANMYLPPASYDERASNAPGGGDLDGADFTFTGGAATADELTALAVAQARADQQLANDGDPPTNVGQSR